jgi:DNA invertase Pin-like site-specific DNA recombinase
VNKAVVYARVSTRGQNPENQLLALRKYAEARGLKIVQFYVDVGQSGGKASRPELDRLMMDARRRRFNVVLVARLDRLARSLKQLVMTLDELRELGISFTSLQEGFDTSTSTGILLFQVVGAIAEFERSLIRERIALGLERARAEGKTIGRPLGAQVDEQELRRLRSEGLSLRAIARQVGISHPTVAAILNGKNPIAKRSLEGP